MISGSVGILLLHARALLGLPVLLRLSFTVLSASRAVVVEGNSDCVEFENLEKVLEGELAARSCAFWQARSKRNYRRMGVILAKADTLEEARAKASRAYDKLKITVH